MNREKVTQNLYIFMGASILIGLILLWLEELRLGLSLIGVGIFCGFILQFIFGEDVLGYRRPRRFR